MAIAFHCEHCGRPIEAPDSAGGRWGRCPSCKGRVYVPDLKPDGQQLKLAPIDEQEEQRRRQMIAETFALTEEILQEKATPIPQEEPQTQFPDALIMPLPRMSDGELTEELVSYLRMMADGDLERAQMHCDIILAHGKQSLRLLDQIALDQISDKRLAAIPHHILAGLIRDLRSKI